MNFPQKCDVRYVDDSFSGIFEKDFIKSSIFSLTILKKFFFFRFVQQLPGKKCIDKLQRIEVFMLT